MASLKGVVQLTESQYNILKTNGTITVDGTTVTFDENALYVTIDSEESSVGDYYQLRLNGNVNIADSNDFQFTNLRGAGYNIHNNSLIFDTTNYDKITIGEGVSIVKITSVIQYLQKSDVTRFGNVVKKNGGNWSTRGNYVGLCSDLTGSTLASTERRIVVVNVFVAEVTQGDVLTFYAKSTGATSSAKDQVYASDGQTHFIVEVVK